MVGAGRRGKGSLFQTTGPVQPCRLPLEVLASAGTAKVRQPAGVAKPAAVCTAGEDEPDLEVQTRNRIVNTQ